MSTYTYNCPCCGAPLAYDAENKNLKCASCGNSYELEALENMNPAESAGGYSLICRRRPSVPPKRLRCRHISAKAAVQNC